ncbi:hypothetical protein RhiirC2_856253, partial [Rhizophagus irregularis]
MDGNSVIEINDNADKIEIDVDKNDVDKISTFYDIDDINDDKIFTFDDGRHNDKPITMIEISPNENYLITYKISPNENYLITYSKEDRSIVGWNVEDIDKVQLKFDQTVEISEDKEYEIKSLCVSDDKKLVYITCITDKIFTIITVIDMNNKDKKKIVLNLFIKSKYYYPFYNDNYCTFNLKGEFILYNRVRSYKSIGEHKIIWIYSTQTKNNKWECKRFYRIPEDYELISISKYDKVYLVSEVSNDYIYEWNIGNINTERGVKIFVNNKDENKFKTYDIGIFSNEKLIFLKINDEIIIYSIEFGIHIASLDINDDIQLYNFMNHTGLFLLPSLFYYTPDKKIKYYWNNKYKNRFNQTLFDEPTDESTHDQTKFVFGILNERVWKSKFDEKMTKTNFSSENFDELNKENNKIIECDDDKINKKTFKHLNVHSFNPYIDTVSTLFQKVITNDDNKIELTGNLIKWDIHVDNGEIKVEVFKKGKLIGTKIGNYHYPYKYDNSTRNDHDLIASSLFNDDDIVILTTFGILIYTFSENNKSSEKDKSSDNDKSSENDKSIFLNYFYFMKSNGYIYKKTLQHYKRIFSKSTLPLPNYDSFRLNEWVLDLKNDKLSLLKYGVELLKFAIKEHNLELIDDIYKKCMSYFKEDLMNN